MTTHSFGEWMKSMAGSVEDKSTFSKDLSNAQKTPSQDMLFNIWEKALLQCNIPIQTKNDVMMFHEVFKNEFFTAIDHDGYVLAATEDEHLLWFYSLKKKIVGD